MIDLLIFVILGVLFVASVLDVKYKAVPSVILTASIFVVLMLRPFNLIYGVLALVFAIMIKDLINGTTGLDFGTADIKILVIIGLLASSDFGFGMMIVLFMIYQFVYTLLYRKIVSDEDEMPFVPCLFFVYLAMILLGGVA